MGDGVAIQLLIEVVRHKISKELEQGMLQGYESFNATEKILLQSFKQKVKKSNRKKGELMTEMRDAARG